MTTISSVSPIPIVQILDYRAVKFSCKGKPISREMDLYPGTYYLVEERQLRSIFKDSEVMQSVIADNKYGGKVDCIIYPKKAGNYQHRRRIILSTIQLKQFDCQINGLITIKYTQRLKDDKITAIDLADYEFCCPPSDGTTIPKTLSSSSLPILIHDSEYHCSLEEYIGQNTNLFQLQPQFLQELLDQSIPDIVVTQSGDDKSESDDEDDYEEDEDELF